MRFRTLRELVLLLPQLAGLIARLSGDPRVPARVKTVLGIAAVFLASPVDLVPDFIPVVGYLDDVVLVAIVLDGLLNHVNREILLEHWPGDPASLERTGRVAARVAGLVPTRWKAKVFGSPNHPPSSAGGLGSPPRPPRSVSRPADLKSAACQLGTDAVTL